MKLLHLYLLEFRACVRVLPGGSHTVSIMFVCGVSVVLLSVVFIIFSVLEVGDGRDAMFYFSRLRFTGSIKRVRCNKCSLSTGSEWLRPYDPGHLWLSKTALVTFLINPLSATIPVRVHN